MNRILLIGSTGQLGWELERSLATLGQVNALDYPQIDLTKADTFVPILREFKPHIVVNAAAYTAVDKAESEVDLAMAINAVAPGILAEEARALGAAFIHYSTDYVFDGKLGRPYVETDAPNPLGVYGRSKLGGELSVEDTAESYLIIRTSWMYSNRRENYLRKVLEWARSSTAMRIVSDNVGSPTWARMLAEATAQIITLSRRDSYQFFWHHAGIYNLAGRGAASRYEFTKAILEKYPHPEEFSFKELLPAVSSEFTMPAARPMNSALDCQKVNQIFGIELPEWQDALQLLMEELDIHL